MTDRDRLVTFANVPEPLADLVLRMAEEANVGLKELRSSSTLRHLADVRARIAYAARQLPAPPSKCKPHGGYSYWQIGRALNRDHSTVIDAERRGKAL